MRNQKYKIVSILPWNALLCVLICITGMLTLSLLPIASSQWFLGDDTKLNLLLTLCWFIPIVIGFALIALTILFVDSKKLVPNGASSGNVDIVVLAISNLLLLVCFLTYCIFGKDILFLYVLLFCLAFWVFLIPTTLLGKITLNKPIIKKGLLSSIFLLLRQFPL